MSVVSTAETKLTRQAAVSEAVAFRAICDGCFERWEFAGSLRRGESEVGDIEHVVIPKREAVLGGLFGEVIGHTNLLWATIDKLVADGMIARAKYGEKKTERWGDTYRGIIYNGAKHEIYLAEPGNWGCILAIRTGPAAFSKRAVTAMKTAGLYRQDGGWVVHTESGARTPCPDEAAFFNFAGVPYADPQDRK